jgi:hypothetical protein
MGPVPIVILRIPVAGREVGAEYVVDDTVVVVVNAVGRRFLAVDPHVRRQVGVGVVDTRIDDRNDHIRASPRGQSEAFEVRPRRRCINRLQVPLVVKERVRSGTGEAAHPRARLV